eukprot:1699406-Rhodomonas_salina.4
MGANDASASLLAANSAGSRLLAVSDEAAACGEEKRAPNFRALGAKNFLELGTRDSKPVDLVAERADRGDAGERNAEHTWANARREPTASHDFTIMLQRLGKWQWCGGGDDGVAGWELGPSTRFVAVSYRHTEFSYPGLASYGLARLALLK